MSQKLRWLLIVVYVVFLGVLMEGSSRLVLSSPKLSNRLLEYDDKDYWWRSTWISRHQTSGTEIFYKFDLFDASKGWISKPNLRDMTVFGNKVLNTNSKGFRGTTEHSYAKDPNRRRIVLLGDSFTFGDEVSDDEVYAHYLQEMLPNVEVINLGVHGYGHDQMLILLREEGLKYQPDIVIVGFLTMDMSRNLLSFRDYAKPRFVLDHGALKLTGTPIPTPEGFLKHDRLRPRLFDIFSIARHRVVKLSGSPETERETEKQAVTTAILTEIVNLTDGIHAVPMFAYLPPGGELADHSPRTPGENYLFSFCREHVQARCLSARPQFAEKAAQGVTFGTKLHWGPEGHRATAETIKQFLVDQGFVVNPASATAAGSEKP